MMFKKEDKMSVVDMVNSSNVIAKESRITGDIEAQGNIRIEGIVQGSVKSQSKVVIGDSAIIYGNLVAAEAEVSGKVDGEVTCGELLHLKKTAFITGDISTQKLVVENGAVFNGKCTMGAQSLTVSKSEGVDVASQKQQSAG